MGTRAFFQGTQGGYARNLRVRNEFSKSKLQTPQDDFARSYRVMALAPTNSARRELSNAFFRAF